MLGSVLRSPRAIQVNIAIMRTFVRLRELLASHEELARQIDELRWNPSRTGSANPGDFSDNSASDRSSRRGAETPHRLSDRPGRLS